MATIKGNNKDNELLGKASNDVIRGLGGDDTILEYYGANGSTPSNDTIFGGDGDDYIHDYGGKNKIYGEAGNDMFVLNAGSSKINGGTGVDTLAFNYADKAVKLEMADGKGSLHTAGGNGSFTFKLVEVVLGSSYDDTLKGNNRANKLDGSGGSDTLNGLDGDDWLVGNSDDKLTGGEGADMFQATPWVSSSTVVDFKSGTDMLLFDGEAFDLSGVGKSERAFGEDIMKVSQSNIQIGKGHEANSTDVHILYDTQNGKLYYDFDGAGGSDAVEALDLKDVKVRETDFFMF